MDKQVLATTKYVGRSPYKVRLVANTVKGMPVEYALATLKYMNKAAAVDVYKAVKSAYANATNNHNLAADKLVVSVVRVDTAPVYKRSRAASKGRSRRIIRRNSHITAVLIEAGASKAEKKIETKTKQEAKESKKAEVKAEVKESKPKTQNLEPKTKKKITNKK